MIINDSAIVAELMKQSEVHEEWLQSKHGGPAREVRRLEVTALGDDAGVVDIEFLHGRETNVWVRLTEGWTLVASHSSLLPSYVDAASARIGLEIEPGERAAVTRDLERLAAMAEFLMEFPLAQDLEAAAVFQA
jgi:hypothetical protein